MFNKKITSNSKNIYIFGEIFCFPLIFEVKCDIINKCIIQSTAELLKTAPNMERKSIMSKRCTKCGTFLTETDRFCPSCGENAPMEVASSGVSLEKPSDQPQQQYTPPQYNQQNQYGQPSPPPYTPSSAPQYNPYPAQEEEMTVGKWILTIIVTGLGLIGLVFLFVWGFGSGPKARQNYCKAVLILAGIGIALYIVLFIFIFAVMGASFSEIFENSDYDSIYSGYEMAKSLLGMF